MITNTAKEIGGREIEGIPLNGFIKGTSTTKHVQQLLQLWSYYVNNPISDIESNLIQNIAAEICSLLLKSKSEDALVIFLLNLPDSIESCGNENILRARLHVALKQKDTKTVKSILQEHQFMSAREELVKIWDEALYIDEELRTGKRLTPLTRFRVRKRHPPPATICSDGVRKTSTLPRESTTFLKAWLLNHLHDPYPSALEKQQLAKLSGLSTRQVKTWFANARRRSKSTDEFRKRCEENLFQSQSSLKTLRSASTSLPPASSSNLAAHGNCEQQEDQCNMSFFMGNCDSPMILHPYSCVVSERNFCTDMYHTGNNQVTCANQAPSYLATQCQQMPPLSGATIPSYPNRICVEKNVCFQMPSTAHGQFIFQ